MSFKKSGQDKGRIPKGSPAPAFGFDPDFGKALF